MTGVNNRKATIEGMDNSMVRHIPGDNGIGMAHRGVNEVITRPGNDRDPIKYLIAVARDPQPRNPEGIGGYCFQNVKRLPEFSDSPDGRSTGFEVAAERLDLAKAEDRGEGVCGAARSGVEIGVHHQHGDRSLDQAIRPGFGGSTTDDPIGRVEKQWVIGNEQINGRRYCRRNHVFCNLVADPNPLHPIFWIAQLKADRIPSGGELGAGPLGEMGG